MLQRISQYHNVDMVGLYRDGVIVKVLANPRAPIQEVPDPPRKFFDDVAEKGSAMKIDVAPSGK